MHQYVPCNILPGVIPLEVFENTRSHTLDYLKKVYLSKPNESNIIGNYLVIDHSGGDAVGLIAYLFHANEYKTNV